MSTGKILEVGRDQLSLASSHRNEYCKNRNWDWQTVAVPMAESAKSLLQQSGVQAVIWPLLESGSVVQEFASQLPSNVRMLEICDLLIQEHGAWWPRLLLSDSLREALIRKFKDIDIRLNAYVVGIGGASRAAISTLVDIGFSEITLVGDDEEALRQEAQYLRRYLLGINIDEVLMHTLTMQTKAGSMMLNTLPLQDNSAALGDLSYFNFMDHEGVVVDICDYRLGKGLLFEADRADLKTLSGLEVQAQWDVDLFKRLMPDQYITFEDYLESFTDFAKA